MSAQQYLIDATTRHQVFLQRYAGGQAKQAKKTLNRLRREINARLSQEPTEFQSRRLNLVLKDLDELSGAAFGEIRGQVKQGAYDLATNEAEFSTELYNKTSSANFTMPSDAALIDAVDNRAMVPLRGGGVDINSALSEFSTKKTEQIYQTIRDGIALGDTTPAISSKVGGVMRNLQARQLESLVRTATNHASSVARAATYEQNADLLEGYEWVSTLDNSTTLICFPAETPVLPVGSLKHVFRRKYAGDMVTIRTSSGKEITGTPNHPVLTDHGWLPINEIEPGKHVVYSVCSERVEVLGDKNVSVPATIGEIYDSLSKSAIFGVELKSPSTRDFHGDGQVGNGDVDIITPERELRYALKPSLGKLVKNVLLRIVHNTSGLSSCRFLGKLFRARRPVPETPKGGPGSFENGVDSTFRSPRFGDDLGRPAPIIKHLKNAAGLSFGDSVEVPAPEAWHHSSILKHLGDCRGGSAILPAQRSGGLPVPVLADDVVSKSVEFKSCHVYNLHTDTGLYTAGSLIVKNCMSRDGQVFEQGVGPMPPAHWGCRSSTIPKVKREFTLARGLTGKRAARGAGGPGEVGANVTYGGWLKRQPKEFVDEALGVERSQLFRSGKLKIDQFVDTTGRVYTIDELKRMNPFVFQEQ